MALNLPVDSPWSWVITFVSFILHGVIWGASYSFGLFYVSLLKEFPGRESETAWVVSINMGTILIMSPLTIKICRKISPRIVCCTGTALAAFALHLASKASNLTTLYLTFGIMHGIGANFSYLTTLVVLRTNFEKHLDLVYGISSAGIGAGGIVFGLLLPDVIEIQGWRGGMRTLCWITLGCAICGLTLVQSATRAEQVNRKSMKSLLSNKWRLKKIKIWIPAPWRNKAFIVLSISSVLVSFVIPMPYCHIVNYALKQGLSTSHSARLPLVIAIGSTVGRLSAGRISGLPGVSRIFLCQITILVLGLAITLCTLANSMAWFTVFAAVFGAFEGAFSALLTVVWDDVFADKEQAMQALGNLYALFCVPYVLSSPLAGWLYTTAGGYQTVFFCCGAILFVALVLACLVRFLLRPTHLTDEKFSETVVKPLDTEDSRIPVSTWLQNSSTRSSIRYRMCSFVDLSVELFSESTNVNKDGTSCSYYKNFLLFLPRAYTPHQARHCPQDHWNKISTGQRYDQRQYTDITEQISGRTIP